MITSIEIQNLRSIKHLKLPLGRLTVLVGENGAGKSSIVRGLQLAAGWARRLSTPDDLGGLEYRRRDTHEWSGYAGNLSLPFYEWARIGAEAPWFEDQDVWVKVHSSDDRSAGDLKVQVFFSLGLPNGDWGTTFNVNAISGQAASVVQSIAATRIAPTDRVSWSPPSNEDYRALTGYWRGEPYALPHDPLPEPPGMFLNRPELPQHLDYYWADFKASLRNVARTRAKRDLFRRLGLDLFGVDWSPALSDVNRAPMSRRQITPKSADPSDAELHRFFEQYKPDEALAKHGASVDAATVKELGSLPLSLFRSKRRQLLLLSVAVGSYVSSKGTGETTGIHDENRALLMKAYRSVVGAGFTVVGERRQREVFTPFDLESLGTRQFLPVMAHLAAADPEWTLITEEPEISLHPKVQVTIAERFVEQAARGIQLIFSTHSHYLLLGICKKIREGLLDPDDVIVLDCKKGRAGTTATRRKVDSEGNIEGWIPSFLEVDDYLFKEWFATSGDSRN